jgi:hypothetical protein
MPCVVVSPAIALMVTEIASAARRAARSSLRITAQDWGSDVRLSPNATTVAPFRRGRRSTIEATTGSASKLERGFLGLGFHAVELGDVDLRRKPEQRCMSFRESPAPPGSDARVRAGWMTFKSQCICSFDMGQEVANAVGCVSSRSLIRKMAETTVELGRLRCSDAPTRPSLEPARAIARSPSRAIRNRPMMGSVVTMREGGSNHAGTTDWRRPTACLQGRDSGGCENAALWRELHDRVACGGCENFRSSLSCSHAYRTTLHQTLVRKVKKEVLATRTVPATQVSCVSCQTSASAPMPA